MAKEMKMQWYPSSLHKHNHLFVKLSVSLFLIGLSFRLFYSSRSTPVPSLSVSDAPIVDKTAGADHKLVPAQTPVSAEIPEIGDQIARTEKCDIFAGDWIPNQSGPAYTNESCTGLEGHQNCMRNGRPDTGYLYWRWNPRDCDLPPFDPQRFLDLMRNKSWAFVGDSISRNHVESLLCILSKVEKAVEVYHDEEYRSKRWHFPSYNFTVSVVWSPFLVKAAIFEDINGVSSSEIQLHLDELDKKWTDQYHSFDYMIVSGGKWFLKTAIYYENDTIIGCHYCSGKNLTELGLDYAYRRTLDLVLNFTNSSPHNATILLRTATPDHFENGDWSSGGTCTRKVPFKEGEITFADADSILRNVELEMFEKASAVASKKGLILKLLDTSRMSLLRPDGHPGPYRQLHPFAKDKNAKVQNDCLHWCLPGPIDSWNDLVMEMVVNG